MTATESAEQKARATSPYRNLTTWLLIEKQADLVHRYVRRRLYPWTDHSEDLVQEVLLAAWQHWPAYQGSAPLHAWLLGVARHKVEDHYRSCQRRLLPLDDTPPHRPELVVLPHCDHYLDAKQRQAQLAAALQQLPDVYQVVLRCRYWEQRSAADTAKLLGKTEKAVERLLARARAQVAVALESISAAPTPLSPSPVPSLCSEGFGDES